MPSFGDEATRVGGADAEMVTTGLPAVVLAAKAPSTESATLPSVSRSAPPSGRA